MSTPDSVEQYGYKQELKRALGFWDLLIYGMAFMAPLAPAAVYGYVVRDSKGMVPLVYLVGAVGMVFTALSYAKMSERFPIAGSVYNYVQRGINPHLGFIAGWLILADYFIIPSAIYLFSGLWLSNLITGFPYWAWIILFLSFNTVVNILGIEFTSKTNFLLVGVQVTLFIIFLIKGIAFIAKGGGAGAFMLEPFYQPKVVNAGFIATAASIAVLSFLGFDAISTLGEEAKNAARDIGRATITSLILLGSMFIILTYVAVLAAPNYGALNPDTAFFDVAGIISGNWLKIAMIAALVCANVAAAMVSQASVSRIFYSLSRDKLIPSFFEKIHPKYKTPYLATIFSAVCTAILAIGLNIENIIKLINFGALTSFMILNFTVFWYFFVKEKLRSRVDIIQYVILPSIGIFILGFVWSGLDHMTKKIGIGWLILGIIYGAIKSQGYKKVPDVFKNIKI